MQWGGGRYIPSAFWQARVCQDCSQVTRVAKVKFTHSSVLQCLWISDLRAKLGSKPWDCEGTFLPGLGHGPYGRRAAQRPGEWLENLLNYTNFSPSTSASQGDHVLHLLVFRQLETVRRNHFKLLSIHCSSLGIKLTRCSESRGRTLAHEGDYKRHLPLRFGIVELHRGLLRLQFSWAFIQLQFNWASTSSIRSEKI